jgi:hypothetical protein
MTVTPFPFQVLPRLAAADLALCNAVAGWLGGGSGAAGQGFAAGVVMGVTVEDWRLVAVGRREPDAGSGLAWLVREGGRALVSLPGDVVRGLARRLLAAPLELEAPRPLTSAEHAVAAMICASALEEWSEVEKERERERLERAEEGGRSSRDADPVGSVGATSARTAGPAGTKADATMKTAGTGTEAGARTEPASGGAARVVVAQRGTVAVISGRSVAVAPRAEVELADRSARTGAGAVEPWSALSVEIWQPVPDVRSALAQTASRISAWPCLELAVRLDGRERMVRVWVPPQLAHRRPSRTVRRGWLSWVTLQVPVVVAAAPMEPTALARLAPRDVVVVAAAPHGGELRLGRGAVAVRLVEGSGETPAHAVIESGYRRAVDPLSDDVTSELTVTLGAATLSLRQLAELAVGQVVPLGRPLGGPFELRVAGKLIGSGELVDVDGALGVRVLSLQP